MKKFITITIIVFVLLLSGVVFIYINNQKISRNSSPINIPGYFDITETPKITDVAVSPSVYKGYKVSWVVVNDPNKLYLYSNLEDKLNSNDFSTKYSCVNLINAGFYDKNDKHIGLFISEYKIISEEVKSDLFNGFLSITDKGLATITDYPVFNPRVAIQTGPYIIKGGLKVILSNANDEYARRIVSGVDKNGRLIFIAVYKDGNSLSGPRLSELPEIIEKLSREKNLNVDRAINLDGGAHSVFLTSTNTLSEASTVGGFFCLKP